MIELTEQEKRQIAYKASLCANCEKCIEKHINKRRVTTQWLSEAIKLLNRSPTNDNEFICASCFIRINSFIKSHDDFEQYLQIENDEVNRQEEERRAYEQDEDEND